MSDQTIQNGWDSLQQAASTMRFYTDGDYRTRPASSAQTIPPIPENEESSFYSGWRIACNALNNAAAAVQIDYEKK